MERKNTETMFRKSHQNNNNYPPSKRENSLRHIELMIRAKLPRKYKKRIKTKAKSNFKSKNKNKNYNLRIIFSKEPC